MIEAFREAIFPIFLALGIILRVLGAAGVGLVIGAVLKNVVDRDENTKYLIPVVFLATILVFVALGMSNPKSFGSLDVSSPGSPGAAGAFGIGLFVSYFLIGRNEEN